MVSSATLTSHLVIILPILFPQQRSRPHSPNTLLPDFSIATVGRLPPSSPSPVAANVTTHSTAVLFPQLDSFTFGSCSFLFEFYQDFRIGVDEWLRVPSIEDVFALGDCAGFLEHTGRQVLPALAQARIVLQTTLYLEIRLFTCILEAWHPLDAIRC